MLSPGEHNITSGLVIPHGVGLRGTTHDQTVIQKLLATTDFTMITMGVHCCIENLSLYLTSAEHHTFIGIAFGGATTVDSDCEGIRIEIDNSTASDVGTSNVYGVHSFGTGVSVTAFSCFQNNDISILSAGLGNKRGILCDTAAHTFRMSTCDVTLTKTGVGAGTYIGLETNFAGVEAFCRRGSFNAPATADISQTLGTIRLGSTNLVNATANQKGFSTIAALPSFGWGDDGATASGTRYLYIGTATASTSESRIVMAEKATFLNLTVRAVVGPGAARVDTWTLRKNGVDTALSVTLTGAQTASNPSTISVTFAAGDEVSLKQVCVASSATSDVQVRCSYF